MEKAKLETFLDKENRWANIPMLPSLQNVNELGKLGIIVQNVETQWSVFQMLTVAAIKSYRDDKQPEFISDERCNSLFLTMLNLYIADVLHRPVKYEEAEVVWVDTFNDETTQSTMVAATQGLFVGLQAMYRALDMSIGDLFDMLNYVRQVVRPHVPSTFPVIYIEPTVSYVSLMICGRLMSWYTGARGAMDLAAFFDCELVDEGSKSIIQQYRDAVTEYNKAKKQEKINK